MLSVTEFGTKLINTGDLDPVYIMLLDAKLPRPLLKRWIIAYTWFYHVGVASYLCEQKDMMSAALKELGTLPRSSERRHFRTLKAEQCLKWFQERQAAYFDEVSRLGVGEATQAQFFDDFIRLLFCSYDFASTVKRIEAIPQYGPWMSFKLWDIGSNVLYPGPVLEKLAPETLKMYSEPTKGAMLVAQEGESVADVVTRLISTFNRLGLRQPHNKRKAITALEVETVLCKYKSHLNGHYPVGKDTHEVREGLDWRTGAVARHLIESCSLWQS